MSHHASIGAPAQTPPGTPGARWGQALARRDSGAVQLRGPATTITRVLVVDDHLLFAEALAVAIDGNPDLACVGTPTTIGEALEAAAAAQPDVVLVDIYLPDGDGIAAIGAIREACAREVRILVTTGYTDLDVMARAASEGACGFIPKENTIGAVIESIRAARDGRMIVDGTTVAAILARVGKRSGTVRSRAVVAYQMTERELEVLDLMGRGLDPHTIATRLDISLHTCRGHQKRILAKLGAHSQLEAVVVAARHGLISALGH